MQIYAISDVHGYYYEMLETLEKAGYDASNENCLLIVCGDVTDRGPYPDKVIRFLYELLPSGRLILIRGNHEDLFEAACMRRRCLAHDLSNGTLGTILSLNNLSSTLDLTEYHFGEAYRQMCPILNAMVDFYETRHYVFCHAWIPVISTEDGPIFDKNWRNSSDWRTARWLNPFEMGKKGLFPEKPVICGHWHSSAGFAQKEGRSEFGSDAKYDIFYGEEGKFIAIDACTARSGKVNCLVIEDDLLEE